MPLESRGKSRSCSIACGHEALELPASARPTPGRGLACALLLLARSCLFLVLMTSLFVGLGPSNLGVLAPWNLHLWGATVMACARTKSGACDPDCRSAFDRSMRYDNCARAAQRQRLVWLHSRSIFYPYLRHPRCVSTGPVVVRLAERART